MFRSLRNLFRRNRTSNNARRNRLKATQTSQQRRNKFFPHFDVLEDRLVPTVVDLTTAGSSGSILNATFLQGTGQGSGTGLIDSFVRLQADGSEQGYNTDFTPFQFDQKG